MRSTEKSRGISRQCFDFVRTTGSVVTCVYDVTRRLGPDAACPSPLDAGSDVIVADAVARRRVRVRDVICSSQRRRHLLTSAGSRVRVHVTGSAVERGSTFLIHFEGLTSDIFSVLKLVHTTAAPHPRKLSCPCRDRFGGVNWIPDNSGMCRPTENLKSEHVQSNRPIHIGTPDTTQTGPSCRVWRTV